MDDLISREYMKSLGGACIAQRLKDGDLCPIISIDLLPSVEPERKKGKWIGKEQFTNSPEFYSWQCSVCGCVLEDPTLDKPYPFCPHCGADMREGEQE